MRALALLLLASSAAASPLTPEKLGLIPELFPDQRRDLMREAVPLLRQNKDVTDLLVAAGVERDFIRRLEEVAPGPLLVERFSHRLVFEAPDLTEAQRALFGHLLPSVDAAQVALWAHRDRLLGQMNLPADDPMRQQIANGTNAQIRDIEKRFWRVVQYALTVDQRAALHKLYPQPYARPPDLQGHIYQLPGLTPSQATRVRALMEELQSESAADNAEISRLGVLLRNRDLKPEERAELQAQHDAAVDRASDTARRIVEEGRKIFTDDQVRHLDACVPMLAPYEVRQHPGPFLMEMAPTPEQAARLKELGDGIGKRTQEIQKETREKVKGLQGEVGAESPQAMTMQMMQQGAQAELVLAYDEAARTAVLEVLEPKQILGWIVTPR